MGGAHFKVAQLLLPPGPQKVSEITPWLNLESAWSQHLITVGDPPTQPSDFHCDHDSNY
jgi:hypothetical protein